ncbi:MAG: hypothetical protein NT069_05645, partial [Planctomycetota bacterium]|nr:hypothetical protein [Planctomycetota bacterium]
MSPPFLHPPSTTGRQKRLSTEVFEHRVAVPLRRVETIASAGSPLCLPGGIVRKNERRDRDPAL